MLIGAVLTNYHKTSNSIILNLSIHHSSHISHSARFGRRVRMWGSLGWLLVLSLPSIVYMTNYKDHRNKQSGNINTLSFPFLLPGLVVASSCGCPWLVRSSLGWLLPSRLPTGGSPFSVCACPSAILASISSYSF